MPLIKSTGDDFKDQCRRQEARRAAEHCHNGDRVAYRYGLPRQPTLQDYFAKGYPSQVGGWRGLRLHHQRRVERNNDVSLPTNADQRWGSVLQ